MQRWSRGVCVFGGPIGTRVWAQIIKRRGDAYDPSPLPHLLVEPALKKSLLLHIELQGFGERLT